MSLRGKRTTANDLPNLSYTECFFRINAALSASLGNDETFDY